MHNRSLSGSGSQVSQHAEIMKNCSIQAMLKELKNTATFDSGC